jgi:hypothetical protein
VVWVDGELELTTCPVRVLTPEVEDAYRWFRMTHEIEVGFGVALWRRRCLPQGIDLGAQDALLMQQLDALQALANEQLLQRNRKGDGAAELTAFRQKHGRR